MILSALWTNKPSRMDSVLDMWIDPRRRAQNYFCMKLCAGGVQHRRDVKYKYAMTSQGTGGAHACDVIAYLYPGSVLHVPWD